MVQCEICGSQDIVKKLNGYVCENCGTKYTLAAMKTMFNGGATSFKPPTRSKMISFPFVNKTDIACSFYVDQKLVATNLEPWVLYRISVTPGVHFMEVLRNGKQATIYNRFDPTIVNSVVLTVIDNKLALTTSSYTEAEQQGQINRKRNKKR